MIHHVEHGNIQPRGTAFLQQWPHSSLGHPPYLPTWVEFHSWIRRGMSLFLEMQQFVEWCAKPKLTQGMQRPHHAVVDRIRNWPGTHLLWKTNVATQLEVSKSKCYHMWGLSHNLGPNSIPWLTFIFPIGTSIFRCLSIILRQTCLMDSSPATWTCIWIDETPHIPRYSPENCHNCRR